MEIKQKLKSFLDSQLTIWVILGFLLITLGFSWAAFSSSVTQLENSSQGHSLVDYLNSSSQRLVKLELMGTSNDELVFNLDNIIDELTPSIGKPSEYFDSHTEILQGISDVSDDWELAKITVEQFRADGDSTALISSSERLFYHAANLTNLAADHITLLSNNILQMQRLIILQLVFITLIIGYRLFSIFMELKHNRELSASLSIDSATGLYNRSKCHEVLRTVTGGDFSSAILVFDLNDLKKTNDNFGHRVGDELIHSFAQLIKEGTQIHTKDVFIGRYGGDEFMVYYNSIDTDDVRLYLEEVAFLTEAFNEKETRFQISYAVGYAVSTQQDLTLRQLFDIADEEMYRNKAAMKQAKANMQAAQAEQIPAER